MELPLLYTGKLCPYCGSETKLVDSSVIYGRSYGNIYLCTPCDAYVGTHKDGVTSKGSIANRVLRDERKKAHAAFDRIWQEGHMKRTNAYEWLYNGIGTERELTHIGMFDEDQCKKVVQLSNDYMEKVKFGK